MHKKVQLFASHVNAYGDMTSAKDEFSNHLDGMTCSVEIPISLLPQLPLSSPCGLMNKVAMVVGMQVSHGLGNTCFHSPDLATATAECLACQ